MSTDLSIDVRADGAFCDPQVEIGLKSEPELGRDAEVLAQSQRSIAGDGTLSVYDGADAAGRDGNIPGEAINAYTHWFHELLEKDLSGMNGFEQFLASDGSSFNDN